MTSKPKLNGSNTRNRLTEACVKLRCTESQFSLSVSAAIQGAGRISCPPEDKDCVASQIVPYVDAVLRGEQKRLPLVFIKNTGKAPDAPPKPKNEPHALVT